MTHTHPRLDKRPLLAGGLFYCPKGQSVILARLRLAVVMLPPYLGGMTSTFNFRLADLPVDLTTIDWIVLNTSGGKDSQAMLDAVVQLCDQVLFPRERIIAVHCDLGRMEWEGTRALAQEQVEHYPGVRFVTVQRQGTIFQGRVLGDLLDHTIERHNSNVAKGKDHSPWFNRNSRYCTSDHKTSQVAKLVRSLETSEPRKVRVLQILGIRADESRERSTYESFGFDALNWSKAPKADGTPGVPSTLRTVYRWLPIFNWTEAEVWERIRQSGVRSHWAYDEGMPRLSCAFCLLASPKEWAISVKFNRKLAEEFVKVERIVGHAMAEEQGISMQDIIDAADREMAEKEAAA